jgi:hypothetical protein
MAAAPGAFIPHRDHPQIWPPHRTCIHPAREAAVSPTYVVTLHSSNGDRDSIHGLRATLKFAGRRGLRALYVRELKSTPNIFTSSQVLDVRDQKIRGRDARRGLFNTRSVGTEFQMVNLKKIRTNKQVAKARGPSQQAAPV